MLEMGGENILFNLNQYVAIYAYKNTYNVFSNRLIYLNKKNGH